MTLFSNLLQRGKEFSTWWSEVIGLELPVCEARRKIVGFDPHERNRQRLRERFERRADEQRAS